MIVTVTAYKSPALPGQFSSHFAWVGAGTLNSTLRNLQQNVPRLSRAPWHEAVCACGTGCPSEAMLLRCREWACPRWAISKNPKEIKDGHMPYGRISHDEVLRTVNTRTCEVSAGFSCLHPDQPRVLSVREVARAQVRDPADDRPGGMGSMTLCMHTTSEWIVQGCGRCSCWNGLQGLLSQVCVYLSLADVAPVSMP